jgi:cysteine-rich repeat protein
MIDTDAFTMTRAHARLALAVALLGLSACPFSEPDVGGFTSSDGSSGEVGTTTATTTIVGSTESTSHAVMDSTADMPSCGNGLVEGGEVCDDGINDGSHGGCEPGCTSLAPYCGDDEVDGPEACDDANRDSTDGCLSDCTVPTSCMDVLLHDPAAVSGIHTLDSDGPGGLGPYEAHCDMEHAGGGWTLVIVSADDGHDTWTWQNHELLTTDTFLVGNVAVLAEDYKSAAHHLVEFSDSVGDGTQDVATFMSLLPFPQCDLESGYPMTDGELTTLGTNLCNTDLYFHMGDYDGSYANQVYCESFDGVNTTGTYGPVWNAADGRGCPMDEPDGNSLGPSKLATYELQPPEGIEDVEWDGRGFANGMGLMQANDRFEMYVR